MCFLSDVTSGQGGVTQARIERHNVLQRARVAYPSPLTSVILLRAAAILDDVKTFR